MADFSSLKQTIQSYIKQNGNEEITGNILQDVLLAMVSTMGDSAINSLASALQEEIAERQNQDGNLQGNITAEATARRDADTALGGRIDGLQTAINGINTMLAEGYIYAGIATPSTNPGTISGKVFYIAVQAGTYTNFGGTVVAYGINILKYNGSAWSSEQIIAIDDIPTAGSDNPVKSGGAYLSSYRYNIFNKAQFMESVKELYTTVDLSEVNCGRLYFGASGIKGFHLCRNNDQADVVLQVKVTNSSFDANNCLMTDGSTYWAVVDWEKIESYCGSSQYLDVSGLTVDDYLPNHIEFSPYIKAWINSQNKDEKPVYGSNKDILSGGLYDDIFGGITVKKYNMNNIKVGSTAGNIVYGSDNNGKITATVTQTGDTIGFYFGYGKYEEVYKANKVYKFRALFKNEGFSTNGLKGIIRVYSGGSRILQTIITPIVNGNYITFEYEYSYTADFSLRWFCLYQNASQSNNAGAKLTYLDFSMIEENVQDNNTLDGVTNTIFKDISSQMIEEAITNDYQHVVDVYPDNNTPCQIANLIRGIYDASPKNRYKIIVHDGEYAEIDIITKDYVDIVGESYNGTILVHDGDATYNSPSGYSFGSGSYDNIPVNTIPKNYKHLIYHMSESTVSNLTLKTVGGACKYICHQDGGINKSNLFTAVFDHCCFDNGSGSQIIGIGTRGGQTFKYAGCLMIDNRNRNMNYSAFNFHNTADNIDSSYIKFERCNFVHCGWFTISELGSGHTDFFEFIDCGCDDPETTFFVYQGLNGIMNYDIILRVVGGNLGGIVPDNTRPDTKLTVQARNIAALYNVNTITFGTALTKNGSIAANANDGFYFKISDIAGVSLKTVNIFSEGYGLCVADNYAVGDSVYINNGKFTKTAHGNVAGTVVIANDLSGGVEDGYILIKKSV